MTKSTNTPDSTPEVIVLPPESVPVLPTPEAKYTMPITHSNGKFAIDVAQLPPASVNALCQQAVNHRLGNQVDAVVNSWIRVDKLGLKASNDKDATAAEKATIRKRIQDWRDANRADVESKTNEEKVKEWQSILDGSVAVPTRGMRMDPVDREFTALVVKNAKARLASVSADPWPSKDEIAVTLHNGKTMTRGDMIEAIKARQGDQLMATAKQIVAARDAKVEAETVDQNADF